MINSVSSSIAPLTGVNESAGRTNQNTAAASIDAFSQYLGEVLDQLNQKQVDAEKLGEKLAAGEVQDLHQVMIAAQEASLSLSLAVQVRNKVIEAYQEIMRMPL